KTLFFESVRGQRHGIEAVVRRPNPFFGIFAEFGLSRHFSLVVELNSTSQGGKNDGMQLITNGPPGLPPTMDLYADFQNETILDYIELPVLARLTFGEKVRFFINAGPYAGYLIRARAETSGSSLIFMDKAGTMPIVPSPVSFNASTDVMASLEKWNFGLAGGGGVIVPAGPGSLILEAHFELGLSNIQKDIATSGKNQTGAIIVSLGYEFTL
ncbi:MAG: porin family protein, partial [Candidatus Aminicenantales bacterium]